MTADLPEMLQRERMLDPAGIVPELPLLCACLRDNPTIADNITLEAPPQAALFSWMNQDSPAKTWFLSEIKGSHQR